MRRDRCRPESCNNFRNAACDLSLRALRIDKDDGTGLGMTSLPHRVREFDESGANEAVERVAGSFHPVLRTALRHAGKSSCRRQIEQNSHVWNQTTCCERVGTANLDFRQASASHLVRISGQEESVGNYEDTAFQ